MLKRVTAFILTALLLAGSTVALASAGSQSDPLISVSFAKSWADGLTADLKPGIDERLEEYTSRAISSISSGEAVGARRVSVRAGGTVTVKTGTVVTLVSGSATVKIESGAFVNVSVGAAAVNGKVNLNQRYIACEKTVAVVTATSESVMMVDGEHTLVQGKLVFTDVPADAWYYGYVYSAVEKGLIDGVTDTTYEPSGKLTRAQALKLAACMRQLYHDGEVTLENGDPWYKSYVDYAVANGVAEESYASLTEREYEASISRAEYVHLFYNALPESEFPAVNSVADGAIPDVGADDSYAPEIYAFYRAGILDGSLEDGSFLPDTNIQRSEVAAIMARMFDSSERKSITLP